MQITIITDDEILICNTKHGDISFGLKDASYDSVITDSRVNKWHILFMNADAIDTVIYTGTEYEAKKLFNEISYHVRSNPEYITIEKEGVSHVNYIQNK